MMQDGAFSSESVYGGTCGLFIPEYEISRRLSRLTTALKNQVMKGTLPLDIEMSLVTQAIKRNIGMICQYGEERQIWFQRPVCGPESKTWWWVRSKNTGMRIPRLGEYASAETVSDHLRESGYLNRRLWWPDGFTEKTDKGGYFYTGGGLCINDMWNVFLKPQKLTFDSDGYLCGWDEGKDSSRMKRSCSKKKIPERIIGKVENIEEQMKRIRSRDSLLRSLGKIPACGVAECKGVECNIDGGWNTEPPRVYRPNWASVPKRYLTHK